MPADPFVDLALTLRDFTDAYGRVTGGDPWKAGSPVAEECASGSMADEWSQTPSRDAWVGVATRVHAGMDHLRALAELLTTDQVVYALSTVARGAIEAFALANYLGDPGIDSRERVRRSMNIRLESLFQQEQLVSDREDQTPHEEIAGWVRKVLDSGARQGFVVHHGDTQQPARLGGKLPTKTALADKVLVSTSLGSTIYRRLSAASHSSHHGLATYMRVIGPPSDPTMGDAAAVVDITAPEAALHLGGAPISALHVVHNLLPQCGWDLEAMNPELESLIVTWASLAAQVNLES